MVEYIVAIDVTRVRFPADAYVLAFWRAQSGATGQINCTLIGNSLKNADGSIAQWLERLTADQQVPGSNPGWPFLYSARFKKTLFDQSVSKS